jgi:hypothetical protein
MLMSIFTVAVYFYRQAGVSAKSLEIRHIKTRAIYDDVLSDIEYITNMSSDINRTLQTVEVTFIDFLPPPWNISDVLLNYSVFIQEYYEKELNTNITLDLSLVTSEYPIIPYNFLYGYPDFYKKEVFVLNTTNDTSLLSAYELNAWLASDTIQDVIWIEAEDFSGTGFIENDAAAYAGKYVKNWSGNLTQTVDALLDTNYTLWVRSADDNVENHSFRVKVDGVANSFAFGDHGTTGSMDWGWEEGDEFAVAGSTSISLEILGSSTAQADVILLKTTPYSIPYGLSPPNILIDTLIEEPSTVSPTTSSSIAVDINVYAGNLNYSFSGRVNQSALSNWSFVFEDNDTINLTFGGVNVTGVRESGMLLKYFNVSSESYVGLETRLLFNVL